MMKTIALLRKLLRATSCKLQAIHNYQQEISYTTPATRNPQPVTNTKFFFTNHNIIMKNFLRKSSMFAIAFVIANLFLMNNVFGQTVTTDALDYPPGATVTIT